MASISDLINLVQGAYTMSQGVSSSKKLVKAAGEKLLTMVPLLSVLQQDNNPSVQHSAMAAEILEGLQQDLVKVKKVLVKAKLMNHVLYVIKASSVRDELETHLRHMHFSMASLGVQQNATMQTQLINFEAEWRKRDQEMEMIRLQEQKRFTNLVHQGNLTENLSILTDHNPLVLQEAYEAMQAEHEEIHQILFESNDSVRISKLAQEDVLMKQIILALEMAEHQNNLPPAPNPAAEAPAWAICPITCDVMADPVTVDSSCQHTFSRAAIKEWTGRHGKCSCPVCALPLRSSILSPSSHLRDAIADLNVAMNTGNLAVNRKEFHVSRSQHPSSDPPTSISFDQEPSIVTYVTADHSLSGGSPNPSHYGASPNQMPLFAFASRMPQHPTQPVVPPNGNTDPPDYPMAGFTSCQGDTRAHEDSHYLATTLTPQHDRIYPLVDAFTESPFDDPSNISFYHSHSQTSPNPCSLQSITTTTALLTPALIPSHGLNIRGTEATPVVVTPTTCVARRPAHGTTGLEIISDSYYEEFGIATVTIYKPSAGTKLGLRLLETKGHMGVVGEHLANSVYTSTHLKVGMHILSMNDIDCSHFKSTKNVEDFLSSIVGNLTIVAATTGTATDSAANMDKVGHDSPTAQPPTPVLVTVTKPLKTSLLGISLDDKFCYSSCKKDSQATLLSPIISRIEPKGLCAKSAHSSHLQLQPGMCILSINGQTCYTKVDTLAKIQRAVGNVQIQAVAVTEGIVPGSVADVEIDPPVTQPTIATLIKIYKPSKSALLGIYLVNKSWNHSCSNMGQATSLFPVVSRIEPRGLCAINSQGSHSLQPGMRILSVNGKTCYTKEDTCAKLQMATGIVRIQAEEPCTLQEKYVDPGNKSY